MAISDIRNLDVPTLIKGPSCTVCLLLEELPEDEAQALRELLGDPRWRYTALAEALKAEGHDVADHALSRHGRGQCQAKTKCR